jgi:hypothetical protein
LNNTVGKTLGLLKKNGGNNFESVEKPVETALRFSVIENALGLLESSRKHCGSFEQLLKKLWVC